MTFRAHPITGDPIVFAPERATRPGAFGDEPQARCPFCRGHESDTPPALATAGDPWRVRVIPNKYPALEGAEVIVESPEHNTAFESVDAEEVVRSYVDRYRAHADAAHVALFKNHGTAAGASIPHLHSQLIPLPFVPPRIAREADAFARRCVLCDGVEGSLIRETAHFRWLAPHGSSMAYQSWIVPKRHVAEMSAFDAHELDELAALLQTASKAMLTLGDSYNWLFQNFARRDAAHCYVELFPRLTTFAGFELSTGTFIDIVDPADAAEQLRNA